VLTQTFNNEMNVATLHPIFVLHTISQSTVAHFQNGPVGEVRLRPTLTRFGFSPHMEIEREGYEKNY
jgi:hypothetical protein